MDKFHTKVAIAESPVKITYSRKCLFMGSCFSDYIGEIMAAYKFRIMLNPFGTLFNPASIAENLQLLIKGKEFTYEDLNEHNGLWFSFSHYTGFSDPDRNTCLANINIATGTAIEWLKSCEYLVLTFGTAWVYKYNRTGRLVANCHKLTASAFTRSLMNPAEIIAGFNDLILALRKYNPHIRVIFTLSPVRHWADGAVNNQLSKAILHYSIQEILKNHEGIYYFPSYEIFMDELRDYRFYAEDMLHPSDQGARYVWERFSDTWIDDTSKKIIQEVSAILKAAGHRPLNAETFAHKKFRQDTLQKIEQLVKIYPFMDFSREIEIMNKT